MNEVLIKDETQNLNQQRVKFKHLSTPLKIAIIFSWVICGIYVFLFMIGFMIGIIDGILGV